MNLPNKLTIGRIGLTAVFMLFLFAHGAVYKILALLTFIAAASTDFLDGYLAKKYGMVSDFGRFMDPIADKVLTLAAFLAFVEMRLVPAWMAVLIIFREFVVTGLRLMALRRNKVIEASFAGKHKTASQMLAIFVILLFIIFKEYGYRQYFFEMAIFYLMLITVAMTLVSGAAIFMRNKEIIYAKKPD